MLLPLWLTGHSGDRKREDGLSARLFQTCSFLARGDDTQHKGVLAADSVHRGCTCLQPLKRKGHAEAEKRMCLHFLNKLPCDAEGL